MSERVLGDRQPAAGQKTGKERERKAKNQKFEAVLNRRVLWDLQPAAGQIEEQLLLSSTSVKGVRWLSSSKEEVASWILPTLTHWIVSWKLQPIIFLKFPSQVQISYTNWGCQAFIGFSFGRKFVSPCISSFCCTLLACHEGRRRGPSLSGIGELKRQTS